MSEDGQSNLSVGGPENSTEKFGSAHYPVMLDEVLAALAPVSGELHVDGTFGAGGYTQSILKNNSNVIALDRDPDAIANGESLVEKYSPRLTLVQSRFGDLEAAVKDLGHAQVDGVVLDIGVSSMQLDQAERGFSFAKDGPLDMRMSQSGVSAEDVINKADHSTLTRIIGILGEEKKASKIARAIINGREKEAISNTLQLANLIERTVGRKPTDKIHPATRTFQGLRIFINQELDELCEALFAAEKLLKPGGRLVVVTFHSLEDRIVKRFFASRTGGSGGSRHLPQKAEIDASFHQPKRSVVKPSNEEIAENSRSRSAKLRMGIRTYAPSLKSDKSIFGLPNLDLSKKWES